MFTMNEKISQIKMWIREWTGATVPEPKLRKAFDRYNENAKANQTKPINETRIYLFAVLQTLTVVPSKLSDLNWDIVGDRTKATDRFRACVNAFDNNEKWVMEIPVPLFCESRSANPRYENALRESIRSYYSLDLNDGKNFIVVPNKLIPEQAFVVRIS